MTKKFSELRDRMSSEARADVVRRVEETLEEMLLRESWHTMCNELETAARFPDEVKITSFSQL